MKSKIRIMLFLTAALLIFSGCGYQMGTFGHPQIKSVAVAPAVNETPEVNLSAFMRQYCSEQIQTDGTYKLENVGSGDCELHTRVINVKSYGLASTSTDNESRFRQRAYQVVVEVEYTLIIPGRAQPILSGTVKGRERYQPFLDIETNRQSAIKQACRDASVQIIHEIAEGW